MQDNKDIFISYSHKDEEFVKKYVSSLEKSGVKCWVQYKDSVGVYAKTISEAISKAKVFLLILSENSAVSDNVLNEVEMAYKKKKRNEDLRIQPVAIDNLDLEDEKFDSILYYISRINFMQVEKNDTIENITQKTLTTLSDIVKPTKTSERIESKYYIDEIESIRLKKQTKLLRKFDAEIYEKYFSAYSNPDILDLGSGNADFIFDRMGENYSFHSLVCVERDVDRIAEGKSKYNYNNVHFVELNIEHDNFEAKLEAQLNNIEIEKFDIINISMLLLHLKNPKRLFKCIRKILKDEGVIIIKDIDDGLNLAYPDSGDFARVYSICDSNEPSGNRYTGRQIYTDLYDSGFRKIQLEKQGFNTIGMSYDERELFFDVYFKFILDDARWMAETYPNRKDIVSNYEWYRDNYEKIAENFLEDRFIFSLGFMLYTVRK